ncbi:MAG: hypothetical protein RR389_06805, partial [Christensenella sp.]
PNVRGVSFKEIKDLFGTSCTYKKKKVTLSPPISRRLSKLGFFILHLFNWRILRTHILVSIRKRTTA